MDADGAPAEEPKFCKEFWSNKGMKTGGGAGELGGVRALAEGAEDVAELVIWNVLKSAKLLQKKKMYCAECLFNNTRVKYSQRIQDIILAY